MKPKFKLLSPVIGSRRERCNCKLDGEGKRCSGNIVRDGKRHRKLVSNNLERYPIAAQSACAFFFLRNRNYLSSPTLPDTMCTLNPCFVFIEQLKKDELMNLSNFFISCELIISILISIPLDCCEYVAWAISKFWFDFVNCVIFVGFKIGQYSGHFHLLWVYHLLYNCLSCCLLILFRSVL